jgi:hypothetical protein
VPLARRPQTLASGYLAWMDRYWFCVKHHAVEGPEGCPPIDRLGPYPTEAEASRALERAAERNAEWDDDPDWSDEPGLDGQSRRSPE